MFEINVFYKPEIKSFSDLYFGKFEIIENRFAVIENDEGGEKLIVTIPIENIVKIVAVKKVNGND